MSIFINLIWLSTSLACALLFYLLVNDELYVDKYFENDFRLYQIMELGQSSEGVGIGVHTSSLLAQTFAEETPQI